MRRLHELMRRPRGSLGLIAAGALALAACGAGAADPGTTTVSAPATTTTAAVRDEPGTLPVTATTAPPAAVKDVERAPYPSPTAGVVDRWVPEVVTTLPHDPSAFTQGLVVRGDTLYESTGLYGESTVRIVDRATGEPRLSAELAATEFGEGLELVGDRLIQLTWREETAIVWDAGTLVELDRLSYEGEGWGLCHDGERFVTSDGSATLVFRDPGTFAVIGEVTVVLEGSPVARLNELECVDGLVFANVWKTTDIVVVDPSSGEVTAVIDASALDTISDETGLAVLNGIAFDDAAGVFLITGKLWPAMYEVRFVAA